MCGAAGGRRGQGGSISPRTEGWGCGCTGSPSGSGCSGQGPAALQHHAAARQGRREPRKGQTHRPNHCRRVVFGGGWGLMPGLQAGGGSSQAGGGSWQAGGPPLPSPPHAHPARAVRRRIPLHEHPLVAPPPPGPAPPDPAPPPAPHPPRPSSPRHCRPPPRASRGGAGAAPRAAPAV